jgi:hypothetical protein
MPDYTFDEWINVVDALCVGRYGISTNDLPDMNYREMYDSEYSPDDAIDAISDMLKIEYGIDC